MHYQVFYLFRLLLLLFFFFCKFVKKKKGMSCASLQFMDEKLTSIPTKTFQKTGKTL